MAAGDQRGERRTGSPQGWEEGKSEGTAPPLSQGNFHSSGFSPSSDPSRRHPSEHIIGVSGSVSAFIIFLCFFFVFFLLQTQPPLHYISMETHVETSSESISDVFCFFFMPAIYLNIEDVGGRGRIRVRDEW